MQENSKTEIATRIANEEPKRGRLEPREMLEIGVTSVRQNGRYVEIRLAAPESLRRSHRRAGQYVVSCFADGEPRFLVLANAPGHAWTLLVDPADELVEVLGELRSGDSVQISAAEGSGYPSTEGSERVVMFATGSGIASVQGVIEELADHDARPEVYLFYGERSLENFAYRNELRSLQENGIVHVGLASEGTTVQDLYDEASIPMQDTLFFLCGAPGMMESVSRILLAAGASADQIATNI